MPNYSRRGPLQTIAAATALLVAVAVGAHVVWLLLAPILPSLVGLFLIVLLTYVLLGLRR
jgi:hypothetical protein